jgi:hypothetical protein
LQLPAYLEHEALHLWRKNPEEILTKPDDSGEKLKAWDPIAAVIKLFKEHFKVTSALEKFLSCTDIEVRRNVQNAQEQGGAI